ncbi:flagellar hook-basal body protein [Jeotgalibacillus sp. S-D1]|uniref:flagellar hook-basal body protein n=1 Tax=Jeotgalibacillus sp. S-D1 TaxID=2552189 RepID=UPI0010595C82|nr:flagellar hook-basal body protein [Jeotgalibacillus sp. S-D1]TDL32900.1 flagellar hook-basal body protein [Jeotgalibacillus sp. S-D1]
MFRGFYTAATGMIAQQRQTELLTNNMSNMNTPGFKADQSSMRAFPDMLLSSLGDAKTPFKHKQGMGNTPIVGALNTGVYMQETLPLFTQGDVRETGLATDMAIVQGTMPVNEETGKQGAVFFTVQGTDGEVRFTRNGNFTLDAQGFLTTADGHYVLNATGSRIELESDQFKLEEDGRIITGDRETARLGISYSDDPQSLVHEGNGLFKAPEDAELADAFGQADQPFVIQQGALERSNVDSARTMTDLMSSYRAFEANQKVLQSYDRSMEKTVNEVGRVNG